MRGGRGGFTLIEMLAVLVILAILMVVLLTQFTDIFESAKVRLTSASMSNVSLAIDQYEHEHGDYPPSSFPAAWGPPPNTVNVGIESLVVALHSKGAGAGTGTFEDLLVNTDADNSKSRLTEFNTTELFELRDEWGNPIAYQHRADYGTPQSYVTLHPDTGEEIESTFRARKNSKTGQFVRPDKYQLVSAGPDGSFGTDDDVTLWGEDP
ncbi:MAG: type II secretion system protein [Planctomycetota bacterium]|nr:MAG: type II secretion system protein [Planctomycetota bacterium]